MTTFESTTRISEIIAEPYHGLHDAELPRLYKALTEEDENDIH